MTMHYCAILPHGFELIPELYPNMGDDWNNLITAMEIIAQEILEIKPDIIIIASPHNLRIDGQIGIITSEWCEGDWFSDDKSKKVSLKCKCERDFAKDIYRAARKEYIPTVSVNYGAADGDYSAMKMDWGTFIPLWSIHSEYKKSNEVFPPIVLITPSREIPWNNLVKLGKIITKVSDEQNKKVVFIASSDHGHAHDPEGPYGYNPASEEFDQLVCKIIKEDKLIKLLDFSPEFIKNAKPDSFWQMLILHGILEIKELRNNMCVYECPSYYGMIVASFK